MKLVKYTASIAAILMSCSGTLWAQQVAIMMDNPNVETTPLMTSEARDQAILDTLKKQNLKIVLFVQGAQVNNDAGQKLLQHRNEAGHALGNHTYSHANIDNMSPQAYRADTLKNESLLQPYTHFRKIFRFPFLSEGSTAAKRDALRAFLNEHHYTNDSVTIDADTAFNDPVFSMVPDTLPAGQSLIWSLAKQTGKYDDELRYPGEDSIYEEKAMDAAGL